MKKKYNWEYFLSYLLITLATAVLVGLTVGTFLLVQRACKGNTGAVVGVMIAVIIVVSFIVTFVNYLRRMFSVDIPVQKILEATQKISAGDFSVKLEPRHRYKRYDEFDCIMENLNTMTAELGRTELLHSDFITNVSHEIKTPVAVISNYATALLKRGLDAETRESYARSIVEASERLSGLVTNTLRLSRLENQEIRPQSERFCLSDKLAEAVLGFEDAIDKKSLQLDCNIDDGVYIVSAPAYLDTVWNNLLSNAVKFTEAGGRIGVSLKKENGRAVVKVSDTGCGISAETGKHIFEKFYQGDTSHTQEGNGLGLAIVKKIINITGGDIKVKSELNKGTEFIITIKAE